MEQTPYQKRWAEIVNIWEKEHQWLYGIAGLLAGFVLGLASSGVLARWFVWFAENFWGEALGIAITVTVIDRLYQQRDRERHKQTLIREMGSLSHAVAIPAVEALRSEGWLQDGTLVGKRFGKADLHGVDLKHAILNRTHFVGANLQTVTAYHAKFKRVQMGGIDLRGARLNVADFENSHINDADARGADFRFCNLENVLFDESDLQGCNFTRANLKGAVFIDANLEAANFEDADFNEETVMPDGSVWTPETDVTRFTDPYHAEFWRPTDNSWLYNDDDEPPPWWLRGKEHYRE